MYSSLADRRRFLQARPALSAVVALSVLLSVACMPAPPTTAAPPPPPTQAAASSTASSVSAAASPANAPSPVAAAGAPLLSRPATKISVSYPEGGAHLPLFYARGKGIFAKNGLDVALQGLGGGPVAGAALQSGEIQIVDITGSEVVNADAAGADIIILATLTPVYPYVFEISQAISSKDDIKGKTIAVRASGDATDIATRVLLTKLRRSGVFMFESAIIRTYVGRDQSV